MSVKKRTISYGIAAIVVAIAVMGAVFLANPLLGITPNQTISKTGLNGPGGNSIPMVIQITDPPNVPNGTTSLNLTYSGFSFHVINNGETNPGTWVNASVSGTVDLLSLVNVSRTVALVQLPNGSSVDYIKFNITRVTINVNGSNYPVLLENSILTIPLTGGGTLENLSSTLLELSPTIHEETNGTTIQFVLVPSATGIVRSTGVATDETQIGSERQLSSSDQRDLGGAYGNISISSAFLTVAGNTTSMSLTIRNNGNVSVILTGITVEGNFNTSSVTTQSVCITQTSTTTTSSTAESGDSEQQLTSCSDGGNYQNHEFPNQVVFASNGTMLLQSRGEDSMQGLTPLIISPEQSATVSFSGLINFTFGESSNQSITLLPLSSHIYILHATFTNEAHAAITVNATST